MLGFDIPKLEHPYTVPFPAEVTNHVAWDDFWTATLATLPREESSSARLRPSHFRVVLRRIRKLRAANIERVLFVANGVSLLPHFFSYGGIPQVDVVDISTVAMEYCRHNPPQENALIRLREILLDDTPEEEATWNDDYQGLKFLTSSLLEFESPRPYDCIFVYNFLEFFDDRNVLAILRRLNDLLTENGALVVGGLTFDGHYNRKVNIAHLHTLFTLFASSGFHFVDQTALINEIKGRMWWFPKWFHRHVFCRLDKVRQPSRKTVETG